MRRSVTRSKLEQFMKRLGEGATGPGTVYLTGGSTALLLGWREQTVDIDVKLDPEPAGAFQAIATLKESLGINVELAAPDQFIPPLPGWQDRSSPIMTVGRVNFKHYDFYAQALSKIERGLGLDLIDARALVDHGLVEPDEIARMFEAIQPELIRYPGLDAVEFERKVQAFLQMVGDQRGS